MKLFKVSMIKNNMKINEQTEEVKANYGTDAILDSKLWDDNYANVVKVYKKDNGNDCFQCEGNLIFETWEVK